MYRLTRNEWNGLKRNHPDYAGQALKDHEFGGKVCRRGDGVCFECLLPGAPNTGAVLLFEHIHFEIIG